MTVFKAIDSRVEVNGQTVFSVVDGMGKMKSIALEILKENGIAEVDPKAWYPQQKWLNAFKQIASKIGPATLNIIGRRIPENAEFPAEIDDIHKALASIDIAYHMNHRIEGKILLDPEYGAMKEGIGHYRYAKTGERSAEIVCDNPYPCEFDRGIITAMAQKFRPDDSFGVDVEDCKECRMKGDECCTYKIRW